jgi:hypothetical protein
LRRSGRYFFSSSLGFEMMTLSFGGAALRKVGLNRVTPMTPIFSGFFRPLYFFGS